MEKSNKTQPSRPTNPLSEPTQTERGAGSASAETRSLPEGMARHFLRLEPATGFEYRYKSAAGDARVIH
jgi:hypothetical protein